MLISYSWTSFTEAPICTIVHITQATIVAIIGFPTFGTFGSVAFPFFANDWTSLFEKVKIEFSPFAGIA